MIDSVKREVLTFMQIFDTHAHYDDEAFNDDRKELLEGDLLQDLSWNMRRKMAHLLRKSIMCQM